MNNYLSELINNFQKQLCCLKTIIIHTHADRKDKKVAEQEPIQDFMNIISFDCVDIEAWLLYSFQGTIAFSIECKFQLDTSTSS